MQQYERLQHVFGPVWDEHSRCLILGSFPSVKSREQNFYYGHPRNRFWHVCGQVCEEQIPETIPEKREFLLRNHIALWDVIAECDIIGSSDSSIRNVTVNELGEILEHAPIQAIYANGGKAYELYMKYTYGRTKRKIVKLPSTSPANAACKMPELIEAWKVIRKDIL